MTWQTIDSAPKDGSYFLAYRGPCEFGHWNTLVAIKWDDDAGDFVWPDEVYDPWNPPDLYAKDEGGYFVTDFYESRETFTHWMPLPDPPVLP